MVERMGVGGGECVCESERLCVCVCSRAVTD